MVEEKLQGLGGWLILVIISLFLNLSFFVFDFIGGLFLFNEPYMKIIILLDALMIFLFAYTLNLIFKKKQKAKKYFIITWIVCIGYTIVASVISVILYDSSEFNPGILGTIFYTIIWSWYFKKSIRVKNTFVND